LSIHRELGNRLGIAKLLSNLGSIAYRQADYANARSLCEESLAIKRELGGKFGISISLVDLAQLAQKQHDYPLARSIYEQAVGIKRELGDKQGIGFCLEGLAEVSCIQGEAERAVVLFGAAEALRESIGATALHADSAEYESCVKSARQKLSDQAFKAAWSNGRSMKLEDAIELAVKTSI
jgi:tetratricopeptide (TPR) repeat protein